MQPIKLTKIEQDLSGQVLTLENDEVEAQVFYPGNYEKDREAKSFMPNATISVNAKFKQKRGFMISAYADEVHLDDMGRLAYTRLEKIPEYADKLKQAAEIARTLENALKNLFE